MIRAADQIDDFLEGAGAGTALGERLETLGLVLALPGIVVAIGLIAFILFVYRGGSAAERSLFPQTLSVCGLLVLVGGLVEVSGTVAVAGGGWLPVLTGTTRASLIRLSAGVLMTVGFVAVRGPFAEPWRPAPRQILGVVGAAVGALSFATDGHTITQGNLFIHASLDVVHVATAGVWVGGVVGLLLMSVGRRRRSETSSMTPSVVRFSTVATLAIVTVAAAGVGMSFLIVDSVGDYFSTSWGRWLLVKVGLVAVAGGIGAYNHFVAVPALELDPDDRTMLARVKKTIGVEAGVLLAVMLVTVFLAGASIDE